MIISLVEFRSERLTYLECESMEKKVTEEDDMSDVRSSAYQYSLMMVKSFYLICYPVFKDNSRTNYISLHNVKLFIFLNYCNKYFQFLLNKIYLFPNFPHIHIKSFNIFKIYFLFQSTPNE